MKKLLLITPSFPKDQTESYMHPFLQQVFLALQEKHQDIDITIVAIHRPVSGNYDWHGMKVIPLNGNNIKHPAKIIFLYKSFYRLRKLIKKEKYDGILNLWYNDFSVFTHAINDKTFTWMLGQDVKRSNIYLRLFKPNPNKIMALSEFNNEVLYQTAKIKAHKVIPIAINEKLFPELNLNQRKINVFGAGNLSPLKNYRLFVEVILELKKTIPNIKAEIAGIGEEESELKNFVNENNLQNNITFLGLISHQEILDKMNDSEIFLHTSTFEGGSAVYFEALYSGCQLVGRLPMMDKDVRNFHLHATKTDIVNAIIFILNNPKRAERVMYYAMDYICEEIHDLFYN